MPPLPASFSHSKLTISSSMKFIICILLTILGYIPGIIYVVYVIDHSELGGECSLPNDLRCPVIDA
ncbi:hypothetical protein MKX03_030592 [Papaver bracteatum]|nr:hypothetical protein MKX03_030592 [Papaver bracteatum]